MKYQLTQGWMQRNHACTEGIVQWNLKGQPDLLESFQLLKDANRWPWAIWLMDKSIERHQAITLGLYCLEATINQVPEDAALAGVLKYGYLLYGGMDGGQEARHHFACLGDWAHRRFHHTIVARKPILEQSVAAIALHIVDLINETTAPGVGAKAIVRHFIKLRGREACRETSVEWIDQLCVILRNEHDGGF